MTPLFIAKNGGAKVQVFDSYITVKANFLSREVSIPLQNISSVSYGFLTTDVNTNDGMTHKVALRKKDKDKLREVLTKKLNEE